VRPQRSQPAHAAVGIRRRTGHCHSAIGQNPTVPLRLGRRQFMFGGLPLPERMSRARTCIPRHFGSGAAASGFGRPRSGPSAHAGAGSNPGAGCACSRHDRPDHPPSDCDGGKLGRQHGRDCVSYFTSGDRHSVGWFAGMPHPARVESTPGGFAEDASKFPDRGLGK
jgi:hypothetical protein